MRRIPVRFFFLFLGAICNFLPLPSASAQDQLQKMWKVWRKTDSCSMTRNEWLTVAQESPGYGWQLCNGSTAHLQRASAQAQMDFLKLIQCNADMPNCPRFQNDCCDVEIYKNNRTGALTIMDANETPPPLADGWQLSPMNSPTQCCEEAELAIGRIGCRQITLSDGTIVIRNGPGNYVNKATGKPLPPGRLPFQPDVNPPDDNPPIVVDLDPEMEPKDEADEPEQDNQPVLPTEPRKENPQPSTQPQPPAENDTRDQDIDLTGTWVGTKPGSYVSTLVLKRKPDWKYTWIGTHKMKWLYDGSETSYDFAELSCDGNGQGRLSLQSYTHDLTCDANQIVADVTYRRQ